MRTQFTATRSGTWTQVKTHFAMEAVAASLAIVATVAAIGAWQFRGDSGNAGSAAVPSARPPIAFVGENDTSGFDYEAFERQFEASLDASPAATTVTYDLLAEHDSLVEGALAPLLERSVPAPSMWTYDLLADHDSLVEGALSVYTERSGLAPAMYVPDLLAEHDSLVEWALSSSPVR